MVAHEKVIIIDFGGQYTRLIAQRVRKLKVYCEIVPYNISLEDLQKEQLSAVILSGSTTSINDSNFPRLYADIYDWDIPVLGIGYGMQLMVRTLGGKVFSTKKQWFSKATLHIKNKGNLLKGLPSRIIGWMNEGVLVQEPPAGFSILAGSSTCPVAAMADEKRKLFGLNFHPEVAHTSQGTDILKNFLYDICGFRGDWTMESFIGESVSSIKDRVKDSKVVCGLSGGVDSMVAALLTHKAIGDQLTCIFVDHGLLRKGEVEQVKEIFEKTFRAKLRTVDASAEFLKLLHNVADPEEKRKIIGSHFIRVFEREASSLGKVDFLVQGTLYTDVVESGTAAAATIKSHHNVGGLPERMPFELVEPLRQLFKDEVREVGRLLGLPDGIILRQPFPGPGLAIRVLGPVTKEKLDILREADAIVTEEIKNAGLYEEIWQSFVVLPDIKSVGVKGDERTYDYAVVLRAVESKDGMTADWVRLPYDLLEKISYRVVNEVPQVNRFLYDLTPKPPATIEWE